jgi:hypothetical protein
LRSLKAFFGHHSAESPLIIPLGKVEEDDMGSFKAAFLELEHME